MATASRIEGDVYVAGTLSAAALTPNAGSITDAMVATGADVQGTKMRHRHRGSFAEDSTVTCAAKNCLVYFTKGATAVIQTFKAALDVLMSAAGPDDRTVTVDLQKAGVSVLTGTIGFSKTDTAKTVKSATIASTSLVAGDVLEVVITVGGATGTQAKGIRAEVEVEEVAN